MDIFEQLYFTEEQIFFIDFLIKIYFLLDYYTHVFLSFFFLTYIFFLMLTHISIWKNKPIFWWLNFPTQRVIVKLCGQKDFDDF